MEKFIRVDGCHMCPWNRTKITAIKDGVHRTECGIKQDEKIGKFKECPPLTLTSEKQPIPEWCPLEDA